MNATDTIARRVALTHELAPKVQRLRDHGLDDTLTAHQLQLAVGAVWGALAAGEPIRERVAGVAVIALAWLEQHAEDAAR
ncbi:MAG TPA: hypothetical protein VFJ21_13890 [Mycobacteriales bacterium]|nr:hypothetical protein [Mycobacteriales bacterium]